MKQDFFLRNRRSFGSVLMACGCFDSRIADALFTATGHTFISLCTKQAILGSMDAIWELITLQGTLASEQMEKELIQSLERTLASMDVESDDHSKIAKAAISFWLFKMRTEEHGIAHNLVIKNQRA